MGTELLIRLAGFVAMLGTMGSWEALAPRRRLTTSKAKRWVANLSIVVLNAVLLRVLIAGGAVGMAVVAAEQNWGLLHHLSAPTWVKIGLAIIALDFVLYVQHVLFHAIPLCWRFHMMHHADLDCDVTTGLRFHPVEVVLSMGIKLATITLLGAAPAAVVTFEVLLNATSMFNHSNVWMPTWLDRSLRWLIVTPDMHRIHHSVDLRETNRNFGFNLTWWDRLLGTYRASPAAGHEAMTLGLQQFRDPARLTFMGILALPFVGTPGTYPISGEE